MKQKRMRYGTRGGRGVTKALKKALYLFLAAAHLFVFGPAREACALAFSAQSASFGLTANSFSDGARNRVGIYDHTKLLLHADGADGAQDMTDEKGNAVAVVGGAQIDTAESRFGGSSVYFNNAGNETPYSFTDDFSGILSNWTPLSGGWTTGGGRMYKTTNAHEVIKVANSNILNGTIETVIKSAANFAGPVFRGVDANNYYFIILHSDLNWIHVAKTVGGVDNILTTADLGFYPGGAERTLKVKWDTEGGGVRIKVWLDGVPCIDYLEPVATFSNAGYVGCRGNYALSGYTSEGHYWKSFSVRTNNVVSYLAVPDSAGWDIAAAASGKFTIDAWVKFGAVPGAGAQHVFMEQKNASSDTRWAFEHVNAAGYGLGFVMVSSGIVTASIWGGQLINDAAWHHVAVIKDGGNFFFALDGVLTSAIAGSAVFSTDGSLFMGAGVGGTAYFFDGWMDEIRISKGVARWRVNFTPPAVPYSLDSEFIPSSNRLAQDAMGEAVAGRAVSASFILEAGYVAMTKPNPPVQTQVIPNQTWQENAAKTVTFDLDDYFMSPDGYVLSYAVSGASNISVDIDTATHAVSFSQPAIWFGTEKVKFTATDTEGNSVASHEVTLQVEGVDNTPVLEFIPDISVGEGDLVVMAPRATDLDGDAVAFAFSAPLDAGGQWQTDYLSAGIWTVLVTATDATGLSASQNVRVNVRNVNRPPVLEPLSDVAVNESELIALKPVASDPDGEALNVYFSAPLDSAGKWLTGYDDAGNYTATATISDGIDTVSQSVNIMVSNVNRAPEAALTLSAATAAPGETITLAVSATDPDGDAMTYVVTNDSATAASGALIVPISLNFSFSSVGDHSLIATVTDSGGLATTQTIWVDVVDPNQNKYAVNPVMGDFNADGLTDLGLHDSDTGKWEVALSSSGVFTAALDWLIAFGTSRYWQSVGGDFNGDAKTDIGVYNASTGELKVALSNGGAFSDSGTWLTFSGASASWQPLTGNFNGDKYTDFALYNKDTGEVRVALGTGTGFSAPTSWRNVAETGYQAMGGDFNADGLTDLCLFNKTSGEFKIVSSDTKAFVDAAVWISGFAAERDPILSDFNNDGLTDAGYWEASSGAWQYAISTGSQFSNRGAWLAPFGSSADDTATTGDFNGDGLTDRAVFDRDALGINRWRTQKNALNPCDLMTQIDNGVGGKTKVVYAYAASGDNPSLPFPVPVVSSISLIDTLPLDTPQETYTHKFTYASGVYDSAEREFRGFAKVAVSDPVTGNRTETYFYQGLSNLNQDGALKGQIQKIIAYDGNDRRISEVVNTYDVRKAGPSDRALGFPALIEQTTTVDEENGVSLSTKDRMTYDNIGNVLEAFSDGDSAKTGDEKSSATTYAQAYAEGFNRSLEVSLRDKDGATVSKKSFTYDSRGNLSKETVFIFNSITQATQETQSSYSYDSFGNLLSSTNALGRTTTTEYETTFYAYPQKAANALGHTVTYVYDPKFGVALSVTDPNGLTTSTDYDSFGRPLRRTTDDGRGTNIVSATYSYPDFNTKITTNAIGLSSTEYADGLGRKYKTVGPGEDGASSRAVSTEVFYNSRGLVESESIAHYIDEASSNISYMRYEYDLRGRVIKTISDFPGTLKDAEASVFYVNPLYTETIDPEGHKKGTLKDVYGNVVEVTEFTSSGVFKTAYAYDLQGNLTKTTDSQGNVTQIWHDSLGRKTKMSDPDMGTWTYEYDALGNLIKQTDAKSQVLEFTYDSLNRLTRKVAMSQSHNVAGETTYAYDDTTETNCIGRLSKVTDTSGSTEFFYDALGREIKSVKTVDSRQWTVDREYDVFDRLTRLTYPDGESVTYAYDPNSGLLEKVTGPPANPQTYVSDITYTASGQIKTIQYGNGTRTDYTYGQDMRLSRIWTRDEGRGTNLQDLNYIFDKNGNITTLTDNLRGNIRAYAYDDLGRLIQASNVPSAGGYTTFNYQYDAIGNMTYKSDLGVMTYVAGVANGAGPHAVTSAGGFNYQYDANGNMTFGKNKTMEYDVENRIIKITQPDVTTSFAYDGDGGRVGKTTDDGRGTKDETLYIGSLFEIQKTDDGTQVTEKTLKHIFAGSQRVCSVDSSNSTNSTYFYHSDHLGSSSVITDESGNQVAHYEYTPYGATAVSEVTGLPVTNYFFTGKELDNTGLYFYGARYYDPELGRFITADTIVPSPYDPSSLNRYAYCRNNPLNYIDPTGHFFWAAIVAIAKAAATFAAAHPIIAGAVAGGVIGGANAAISGQNIGMGIGMGMFTGAVGGAVGMGVGGYLENGIGGFWAGMAGAGFGGAAAGASGAGILGGDAGMGALAGFAGGVVAFGGSRAWPLGADAVAGGISSLIQGGDFGEGAKFGAIDNGIMTAMALAIPMEKTGNQNLEGGDLVYIKADGFLGYLIAFFEGGPFSHVKILTDKNTFVSATPEKGVSVFLRQDYNNREARVITRFRGNQNVINAAKSLATAQPHLSYGFFGHKRVCSTTTASAINKGGYQGWAGIGPNAQYSIFKSYGQ